MKKLLHKHLSDFPVLTENSEELRIQVTSLMIKYRYKKIGIFSSGHVASSTLSVC